ncbi:MAG: hypothetical protein KJ689_05570, partial [Bacteroidetes bacterium]|nr:hypothetical protein [Bacteroidota bacterium]
MARFIGKFQDFEKYIGPRLRNIVQTSISRKYKAIIGKCEHCNSTAEILDAAHIHGRERKTIIRNLYEKNVKDGLLDIDIKEFEQSFIEEHMPYENNFKILCKKCHYEYDKVKTGEITIDESISKESDVPDISTVANDSLLPIELYPPDIDEFKELLIQYKSAIIQTFYLNGTTDKKLWNAKNISESSNILGNLRSRKEFRRENRTGNIQKVIV